MNPVSIFQSDFHGLTLDVIDHAGKRWLTAEQVGRCLGYGQDNARKGISKLYNAHLDEFDEADTCVVDLATQGQARQIRIFSGTGSAKLAFFSNTPRAKEFRTWAARVLVDQSITPLGVDARLDRLTDTVEKMAGSIGQLAVSMDDMAVGVDVVLSQLNVTGRYIEMLEKNQRGTVKITPEIVAQAQEMLAAGTPQNDVCRYLRISHGTVWRIKRGEFINRVVSGPSPEQQRVTESLQILADSIRHAAKVATS